MGTNYYLTMQVCGPECPKCGENVPQTQALHIGKSSAGWTFGLHVYPEKNINNLDDWIRAMGEDPVIHNEYDERVTKEFMLRQIRERGSEMAGRASNRPVPSGYLNWIEYHARNFSVDGPCGLLRRKPGDYVSHGEGTYDYVQGEFS